MTTTPHQRPVYHITRDGAPGPERVHSLMPYPLVGDEFVLHGLPDEPDGLRLRVVRLTKDTVLLHGACVNCAMYGACKAEQTVISSRTSLYPLCAKDVNGVLARIDDIPRLAMKGVLS